MGSFGNCSYFVRSDNMKRPDEIESWSISVITVGSFGYCCYYVKGNIMERLMR